MRHWLLYAVILAAAAAGFAVAGFSMRAYFYVAAVFALISVSICVKSLAPDIVKRIFFVVVGIGLIYFLTVELLIIANCRTEKNSAKSYVVVLGAGVYGETPSLSLTHRLQAAEKYLKEYPASKAVLSGGQGQDENISEAECMRRYLIEHNIPESRLILEDESTNTKENLEFSGLKIIEDGGTLDDVAIVSSPYHLYRAKVMAKRLGYIDPAGVACVNGYPVFTIGMFIREVFGITSLWVFGD